MTRMLARTAPWLILLTSGAIGAAAAADRPDFTGAWVLDEKGSQDPALEQEEAAAADGGSGVGRRVLRGVRIFGIPVGEIASPPGEDHSEPLGPADVRGAEHVLGTVQQIRILQQESATEFDYGGSSTAVYQHGDRIQHRDGTVLADWDGEVFEVAHRFDDGTRITETYSFGAARDELRWRVQLEQKGADEVEIERVYRRAAL